MLDFDEPHNSCEYCQDNEEKVDVIIETLDKGIGLLETTFGTLNNLYDEFLALPIPDDVKQKAITLLKHHMNELDELQNRMEVLTNL